jgi:hypothetical protein
MDESSCCPFTKLEAACDKHPCVIFEALVFEKLLLSPLSRSDRLYIWLRCGDGSAGEFLTPGISDFKARKISSGPADRPPEGEKGNMLSRFVSCSR